MSAATEAGERVRELLADTYTTEGIDIWLNARNPLVGGAVPAAMLDHCDACRAEVLAVAEAWAMEGRPVRDREPGRLYVSFPVDATRDEVETAAEGGVS